MNSVCIEVCVDSVASAIAAERGGANRIELCSNLHEGGTTPTAGTIAVVRSRISIPVHVMVRPRSGGFCYSNEEFEIMRREVAAAREFGADGVVLGILTPDGTVDIRRTRELVELARPLSVTFHRAFDFSDDLSHALENVISTGADRILTSGGKQTALEARTLLTNLLQAAKGRITILACGGINANNAATIIRDTGVKELHAGLRRVPQDVPRPREIVLGADSESSVRYEVREQDVRELRSTVDAA